MIQLKDEINTVIIMKFCILGKKLEISIPKKELEGKTEQQVRKNYYKRFIYEYDREHGLHNGYKPKIRNHKFSIDEESLESTINRASYVSRKIIQEFLNNLEDKEKLKLRTKRKRISDKIMTYFK